MSVVGNGAPLPNSPWMRVGVVAIGKGAQQDPRSRALAMGQQRVLSYLEELLGPQYSVTSLNLETVNENSLLQERLSRLADQVWDAFRSASLDSRGSLLEELYSLSQEALKRPIFGPQLQKALAAMAFAEWEASPKRALAMLRNALYLHPEGKLEAVWDWDNEKAFVLEQEVIRIQNLMRPLCEYTIEIVPAGAKLSLNGFLLEGPKVTLYQTSWLRASAEGYGSYEKEIVCERQERKKLNLTLSRETESLSQSFEEVLSKNRLSSLFVLEADEERFDLSLYTQGTGKKRIPFSHPWSLRELAQAPWEESLPLDKEQVLQVLKQQQLASLGTVGAAPFYGGEVPSVEASPSRWYNHWAFWAIAGAVVGGVLITALASKGRPVESRSQPIKIRLQ